MPSKIELSAVSPKSPRDRLRIPKGWRVGTFAWCVELGLPLHPLALGPDRLVGYWLDHKWMIKPEPSDDEMTEIMFGFEPLTALEFEAEFPDAADALSLRWHARH